VGGNFAGLAALRELQRCWKKSHEKEITVLRIVLIDKRGYSEYTPGILRLFCDPGHFFQLAQALPERTSDDGGDGNGDGYGCCSFERIQGTVTSIVKEDPAETTEIKNPAGQMQKVLTYVPTLDDNPSDHTINNNITDNNHCGAQAAVAITPATKNLRYDYLILATGATYTEPISPATPKVAGSSIPWTTTTTMRGRKKEWQNVHERLKGANRVLILGAGAVGVELAAEILDHNNTSSRTAVTIVDARPTLVPLFPRSAGAYTEDWLTRRGAELLLGESLRSWNDRSCTMANGTVVHADVVYVCFGNRPNSEMVTGSSESKSNSNSNNNTRLFSLTRRRNVIVNDTLQLVVNNDTDNDGDGNGYSETPWFACGDVASPPTNDEKQAFQAEMQGKLAARNVIKLLESSSSWSPRATSANINQDNKQNLLRYPSDIAGADRIPLVYVLSLGRYDGVLGFNDFCIPGPLAAIVKWILEHTKVSQMRGRLFGNLIWKIGDAVTLFLSRTLFRSPSPSAAVSSTSTTRSKPMDSSHDRSAAISSFSSLASPHHTPATHQRHQYRESDDQLKLA
jgi:NADH dehydrogenase FAD-containing subunit